MEIYTERNPWDSDSTIDLLPAAMKQTGFPALIPAYVLKVRPSFALMLRKKATDGGQRAKLVVGEGTPVGLRTVGPTRMLF